MDALGFAMFALFLLGMVATTVAVAFGPAAFGGVRRVLVRAAVAPLALAAVALAPSDRLLVAFGLPALAVTVLVISLLPWPTGGSAPADPA